MIFPISAFQVAKIIGMSPWGLPSTRLVFKTAQLLHKLRKSLFQDNCHVNLFLAEWKKQASYLAALGT
jgi:hypothetical protein